MTVLPPDGRLLRRVVGAAAPGAEVADIRGLRDGGSPWLIRLAGRGGERSVVLRVGTAEDPTPLRVEVAALDLGARHELPAPPSLRRSGPR